MSERADPIEFRFSVGSTYTHLAVMRLPVAERETGVPFDWRPFSVQAIVRAMNNVPFATKPVKARHMWRDIERRAEARGLSARLPAPRPLEGFDLANRVAVLGREEGWCRDHARATCRRWFGEGQPAGEEPNLSGSLAEIGRDPGPGSRARPIRGGRHAAGARAQRVRRAELRGGWRAVLGRRPARGRARLAPAGRLRPERSARLRRGRRVRCSLEQERGGVPRLAVTAQRG